MKYRHRGYNEEDRDEPRPEREPPRPRRDPDLPGGRLSEPQRAIRQLRCHSCGRALKLEQDARGDVIPIMRDAACPDCKAAVHACRNCTHFDPEAHLECRKPIKARYRKDVGNDCDYYEPKVIVEMTRDENKPQGSFSPTASTGSPRTASDARKAFDDLFTKK